MNGLLNHWLKCFAQKQIHSATAVLLWEAQMTLFEYFFFSETKKTVNIGSEM